MDVDHRAKMMQHPDQKRIKEDPFLIEIDRKSTEVIKFCYEQESNRTEDLLQDNTQFLNRNLMICHPDRLVTQDRILNKITRINKKKNRKCTLFEAILYCCFSYYYYSKILHHQRPLILFVNAKGLVGKLPGNPASCQDDPCNTDPKHVLYALKWALFVFVLVILCPVILYFLSRLFTYLTDSCRSSGSSDDPMDLESASHKSTKPSLSKKNKNKNKPKKAELISSRKSNSAIKSAKKSNKRRKLASTSGEEEEDQEYVEQNEGFNGDTGINDVYDDSMLIEFARREALEKLKKRRNSKLQMLDSNETGSDNDKMKMHKMQSRAQANEVVQLDPGKLLKSNLEIYTNTNTGIIGNGNGNGNGNNSKNGEINLHLHQSSPSTGDLNGSQQTGYGNRNRFSSSKNAATVTSSRRDQHSKLWICREDESELSSDRCQASQSPIAPGKGARRATNAGLHNSQSQAANTAAGSYHHPSPRASYCELNTSPNENSNLVILDSSSSKHQQQNIVTGFQKNDIKSSRNQTNSPRELDEQDERDDQEEKMQFELGLDADREPSEDVGAKVVREGHLQSRNELVQDEPEMRTSSPHYNATPGANMELSLHQYHNKKQHQHQHQQQLDRHHHQYRVQQQKNQIDSMVADNRESTLTPLSASVSKKSKQQKLTNRINNNNETSGLAFNAITTATGHSSRRSRLYSQQLDNNNIVTRNLKLAYDDCQQQQQEQQQQQQLLLLQQQDNNERKLIGLNKTSRSGHRVHAAPEVNNDFPVPIEIIDNQYNEDLPVETYPFPVNNQPAKTDHDYQQDQQESLTVPVMSNQHRHSIDNSFVIGMVHVIREASDQTIAATTASRHSPHTSGPRNSKKYHQQQHPRKQ